MSSWIGWGNSPFDDMIEKATSELAIAGSEDMALNLEICDQIRSKAIHPNSAMKAIKKRLNHPNPNVQLLTLSLLDVCVKNGGDHFLIEIASREFMDNLVSILKVPALNREVKEKTLKEIQIWETAFQSKPALNYVNEVYLTLKREGFGFPPKDAASVASAMVDTSTAPEWIDSDVCLRCRTPFSFTNRRHHCRNCGKVFDQQCSSKVLPLPHFGITEPVRVCDACHITIFKKKITREGDTNLSAILPPKPRTSRVAADYDLEKAIALSLQESQAHARAGYVPGGYPGVSEPPVISHDRKTTGTTDEEDDPELRAAIEASLREMQGPKASAPDSTGVEDDSDVLNSNDLHPMEADSIMVFNQTIQEAAARGTRDLVRYPGVGELYQRADELKPKMASNLEDAAGKEQLLSEMHEKLSEAVKLYDRLLTEQVSRPIRRYGQYTPITVPPTSYVAQTSTPSTFRTAPTSQWSLPPQVQPMSPPPLQQQPYQPQRQLSYHQPSSPSVATVPVQQPSMIQQQRYDEPNGYAVASPQTFAPVSTHSTSSYGYVPQQVQAPPPPPQQFYQEPPRVFQQVVSPPPQPIPPTLKAASPLPSFPSAPTALPESTYSFAPPPNREPKEAMLISFD